MNHKEMNAELASLCDQLGIYCWINAGEVWQRGTGWVDAIALGRGVLFIENKTEGGRCTRSQLLVAASLRRADLEYRLYRPADYESGVVRLDLKTIA